MTQPYKRRWGDRKDGRMVRDGHGLQTIMCHLWPNRTDCEVFWNDTLDATEMVAYLEKKNAEHPEYRTTIFHAIITIVARMIYERPQLNRFIQGRRMYDRNEITLSFVAKRRFQDTADEALLVITAKDDDTLDTISSRIRGDVNEVRKTEHATGGVDQIMDKLAKLPRPLLMLIVKTVRILDFWGINPDFLTEGDPNYSTVLLSNLGSIHCSSVYHHLSNYGTNSIMVTVGTLHKEEMLMEDGHREVLDVIDVGATLDERISDGFYMARCLKLIQHILSHPELLDRPLSEPSNFDYK